MTLGISWPEWMLEGSCRQIPKENLDRVFWGTNTDLAAIEAAKTVCLGCPVRETCLEYALQKTVDGIWGGTTPEDRKELSK